MKDYIVGTVWFLMMLALTVDFYIHYRNYLKLNKMPPFQEYIVLFTLLIFLLFQYSLEYFERAGASV